jgi:hypothetical protein
MYFFLSMHAEVQHLPIFSNLMDSSETKFPKDWQDGKRGFKARVKA